MRYKKQTYCIYRCEYHIVIEAKYRRKIFNRGVIAYFRKKLKEIRTHYPELDFIEVNHDQDHVHCVPIPPKMSIGEVVRLIKANTSRGIKEQFRRCIGARSVFGRMVVLSQR